IDTIPNGATQAHPRPLHRHIEGGDRLVGDQNLRAQRQRARNTDPLPLTAGELVWVTVGDGWFEPDQAQQFAHRLHGRLARLAVHDRALRNELPNGEAGVKRSIRILEDHLDLFAIRPPFCPRQRPEVYVAQAYLTGVRLDQTHDAARKRALARSGLAYDA